MGNTRDPEEWGLVTIRLELELREALIQVASKNDRSLSAEVRRALRAHVEAERVAA